MKKLRQSLFPSIAVIIIALGVLLYIFPLYRMPYIVLNDYYTTEQIAKALFIGSLSDRREVKEILQLADKAFNDTSHTKVENEEEYGLLSCYATQNDSDEVLHNEHSLKLWSSHLGEDVGWIWVFYTSETFSQDGSIVCGSWRIPSLWKVEKSDAGKWVVVQIREHP